MTTSADQQAVVAPALPSAADLLAVWEWGLARSVAERAMGLLAAFAPDSAAECLVTLTIGERDLHLLDTRRLLFGPEMDCVVSCPRCSADLEMCITVEDVLARSASPAQGVARCGELAYQGWNVRFRMLDSGDLIKAMASTDPAQARNILLHRCVLAAVAPEGAESEAPGSLLPPDVEAALLAELERRDLVGPVEIQLTCPDCEHAWSTRFDILGYLWEEIDRWAYRTLREVHELASAYGWCERDILALSAWRRDAYLQMTGHG